jgi:hypothetical protein
MLPHQKNKQTISILNKLKQKGPPPSEAISLDLSMGAQEDLNLLEADPQDLNSLAFKAKAKAKKLPKTF